MQQKLTSAIYFINRQDRRVKMDEKGKLTQLEKIDQAHRFSDRSIEEKKERCNTGYDGRDCARSKYRHAR